MCVPYPSVHATLLMIIPGVFNTEAHPFQAPPPKPSYGSGKLIQGGQMNLPKQVSAPLPLVSFAPVLQGHK